MIFVKVKSTHDQLSGHSNGLDKQFKHARSFSLQVLSYVLLMHCSNLPTVTSLLCDDAPKQAWCPQKALRVIAGNTNIFFLSSSCVNQILW